MERFRYVVDGVLKLIEESIILQGFITVGLVGATVYLYASGKEVPSNLLQLTWAVLGFWFGVKVQHGIDVAAIRRQR